MSGLIVTVTDAEGHSTQASAAFTVQAAVPPSSFLVGAASDAWATLDAKCGKQALARVYDSGFSASFPKVCASDGMNPAGRTVIYSCKPAAGLTEASVSALMASVPAGQEVIFSMQHEASNPKKLFTTAAQQTQLKADWVVFAKAVHAAGHKTIWIEMDYTWQKVSGRVPESWYPGDAYIDYIGVDTYNNGSLNNPQRWDSYGYAIGDPVPGESLSHVGGGYVEGGFLAWVAAHHKPWFVTEWNTIRYLGTDGAHARASYLAGAPNYFRAKGASGLCLFDCKGRTSAINGESWPLATDPTGADYAAWATAK